MTSQTKKIKDLPCVKGTVYSGTEVIEFFDIF